MKNTINSMLILSVLLISMNNSVSAQKSYAATKQLSLTFSSEEGTNGTSVAWNAIKKLYYAVIAGNASFPLETFSEDGRMLFNGEASVDVRGMWFNPKTKKLEGNCAGDAGYFSAGISSYGEPSQAEITTAGQNQPDFNNVGAFDAKKKKVYFYQDGQIYAYKAKGGSALPSIKLSNLPCDIASINMTSVIFTGRKGEELGVLDYEAKRVYLVDLKGNYKAVVSLPANAVTHDMFRFSYANDKIWLYDVDTRTWTGYSF